MTTVPMESMYGIFTYTFGCFYLYIYNSKIYGECIGKCTTIHGWYGVIDRLKIIQFSETATNFTTRTQTTSANVGGPFPRWFDRGPHW